MKLTPEIFAQRYSIKRELVDLAYKNLSNESVILLSVSGKLGAGKDTIAPLLMEELHAKDRHQDFFAKPLKREVNKIITFMRSSNDSSEITRILAKTMNAPQDKLKVIVKRLWEDVKEDRVRVSTDRTDESRFALQYWGTQVRRAQDYDYWVKITIRAIVEKLAAGVSVFVTDARFENEIDSLKALGAINIRLKVSKERQRERIFMRDGFFPTDEALKHISETSLDDYEKLELFTTIIDTDNLTADEAVAKAMEAIKQVRKPNHD